MHTLCAPFRLCITHNWQSTVKRPSKSAPVTEGDYSANNRLRVNIHVQQNKLEIWGNAQRESTRRPKSDWGKLEGGKERGRISPASKSRGPNSNALAYAERALST